jgi:hypothetical protein
MKKLRTEIFALAEYAVVDQTNKVSIMGIFDELHVEKFPGGFVNKFLVATIIGEPEGSYSLVIKLEKEGEKKNLLNPTIVNAKFSLTGKHNLIVALQQVGFETEGVYYFRLYSENDEIGVTRLEVKSKKVVN